MSKAALDSRAKIKNPKDNVWYVKSLFFAYLAMEKYNLFNRIILDREQKPYDKKVLLSNIVHADEKIQARQTAQQKIEKEKQQNAAKDKKSEIKKDTSNKSNLRHKVSTVRHSKTTKNTSTVKTTKNTKNS